MLKGIGFLFILLGSTGIGLSYSNDYKNRLKALQNIHKMIEYISDCIFVKKDPLSEAFLFAAKRMENPYRRFLTDMYQEVEERGGESIETIWKEKSIILEEVIKNNDYEQFSNAMIQTGFESKEGQLRALEDYKAVLSEEILFLKENKREKCRLYEMLGIMCGVLCILILW